MNLNTSIILTLGYSAQFSQALNQKQIWHRLIGVDQNWVDQKKLNRALINLVNQKLIINQNSDYTLSGFANNFAKTTKAKIISGKYWRESQTLVNFLKKIPWVAGVAITGSVAVDSAKKQDDLDVFIVTTPNRIWLTRLVVYIYSIITHKKRPRGLLHRSGWCFNLWLSQDALSIPRTRRSIYTAYDFVQASWLLASPQLLESIITCNNWVTAILPFARVNTSKLKVIVHKPTDSVLITKLLDITNWLVYQLQKLYMRAHLTTELVDERAAFFHPKDSKTIIYAGWKKTIVFWRKIVGVYNGFET